MVYVVQQWDRYVQALGKLRTRFIRSWDLHCCEDMFMGLWGCLADCQVEKIAAEKHVLPIKSPRHE